MKLITCGRCHGNCVAGSRFCKFCGAPLEETAPPQPRVETARPVPRAAPPPPARGAATAVSLAAVRGPAPSDPIPLRSPIPPRPRPPIDDAPPSSPPAAATPEPRPVAAKIEIATSNAGAGPSSRPKAPVEPGRRAEISVLAGSPIPAEPTNLPPQRAVRDGVRRETGRKHPGRLVVIVEDGSEGRSFSLADGQLDIGRTDGDIVLEDDHYVSPRHARLRFLDGQWILRDLDSTNHVYLRIRKPQPLKDGDLLLLGLEVLQFQTVSDGERGLGHAMQHGTLLFGSPATPRRARLCQRTVEGVVRDVFHLFRDETVIGRETGDIVFTADPFLSRRHAALRRSATTGEFSLLDLDSSNGTFIAIQGEVSLANGDFLRIGQHLFRVDLG
jgi:pSer/pThr/pTyr-binding forkhead associated (FHA) protein